MSRAVKVSGLPNAKISSKKDQLQSKWFKEASVSVLLLRSQKAWHCKEALHPPHPKVSLKIHLTFLRLQKIGNLRRPPVDPW